MRRMFLVIATVLVGLLIVADLHASSPGTVLILISREGGLNPDLMIRKEIGVMKDMLKQAGFLVKVSSPAGKAIVGSKITLTPGFSSPW